MKQVDILMAIRCSQSAWKEVTSTTIKICFEKCGFYKDVDDLIEVDEDLKFQTIVKELCPELSCEDYIDYDLQTLTDHPVFNIHEIH